LIGNPPETYQKKLNAGQEPNPGRGLINLNPPLEFQCALPGDKDNVIDDISSLFVEMSAHWKSDRPLDVEALPFFINVSEVEENLSKTIFPVGKSQELLEPVGFSLSSDGPLFMVISMTSGLGKTAAIQLWVSELLQQYKPNQLKLVLIDYHTRTLRQFSKVPNIVDVSEKKVRTHVTKKEDLKPVIEWLRKQVDERRNEMEKLYSIDPENFDENEIIRKFGYILVVIDDYEAFYNSKSTEIATLTSCISDGEEVGVRVIIAEDFALLPNDELIKRAKKYGCGLLLGGTGLSNTTSEGITLFNGAQPPYGQKTANLPPGRGYLVKRGQAQLIQAFAYWDENQNRNQGLHNFLNNQIFPVINS